MTAEVKGYLSPGCADCAKKDDHGGWKDICIVGKAKDVPLTEQIPGWEWVAKIHALIDELDYILNGVPGIDDIRNAGDGNNYVLRVFDSEVVSVAGAAVTVEIDGNDPGDLNLGNISSINPDWPGDGGRLLFSAVIGMVMVGWVARFESGFYSSRMARIRQIDRSGVNDETGMGTAVFTLDQEFPHLQAGDVFRVYWPLYQPPEFRNCRPNYPMVCGDVTDTDTNPHTQYKKFVRLDMESGDFPVTGVFLLRDYNNDECRIANPRLPSGGYIGTVNVLTVIDGGIENITARCISERRFVVNQTAEGVGNTRLHLGTLDGHGGNTLDDLLDGVDRVIIDYWPETGDDEKGAWISQRVCKHAGILGVAGSYVDFSGIQDDAAGNYCWGCLKRHESPSRIATFEPICYQPDCDQFEINVPFIPTAADLDDIWNASDTVVEQGVPGLAAISNQTLRRIKHSSLSSLAGKFRLPAPASYRALIEHFNNGGYGFLIDLVFNEGGVWRKDHTQPEFDTRANFSEANVNGLFPRAVAGWRTKPRDDDETLNHDDDTDPNYAFRNGAFRQRNGYTQDEGEIAAGRGENTMQRIGEYQDTVLIPHLNPTQPTIHPRGVIGVDYWDAAFQACGPDEAVYRARLLLNTWNEKFAAGKTIEAKTTGTILAAVDNMDGTITLDLSLGEKQAGTNTGNQEDRVVTFMEGGNHVDRGDPFKWNNWYAREVYGGQDSKAKPGDGLVITNHPLYSSFTFFIKEAIPHGGTPPATKWLPADQGQIAPIYARRALAGVTVAPYVTTATITDSNPVASIYETATPANVLTRVDMAESPAHGGEAKFEWNGSVWVNQADGSDTIAAADFVSTGIPPGSDTAAAAVHSRRLLDGEYWLGLAYDHATQENRWTIRFSQEQTVLNVTISWAAGGTAAIAVYQPDVQVSTELYDALGNIALGATTGPDDEYIGLYITSELTRFKRTDVTTPADWYDGADPNDRNQFCLVPVGDDRFVRFHRDRAGLLGQGFIPAYTPTSDPDSYYGLIATQIGRPGENHEDWGAKPDQVIIVKENNLPDVDGLVGLTFAVRSNVIASPLKTRGVRTDLYANEETDWAALTSGVEFAAFWATGAIYFEQTWWETYVSAVVRRCLEIKAYFADRTLLPRARVFEDTKAAVIAADTIRCTVGGAGVLISENGIWQTGGQSHICDGHWKPSNYAFGITKGGINEYHPGGSIDDLSKLLLESGPYTDPGISGCGADYPWEDDFIQNEGDYVSDFSTSSAFEIGVVPVPGIASFELGVSIYGQALAFNIRQVLNMFKESGREITIVAAGCEVKLDDLEVATYTRTRNESGVKADGSSSVDTAGVALLVIGIDPDGNRTYVATSSGSEVETDTWTPINITEAVQGMYNQKKDFNFAVLPSPSGINIFETAQQGKASLIDVRDMFGDYVFNANQVDIDENDDMVWTYTFKLLRASTFMFRNVWVQFALPDGTTDVLRFQYEPSPPQA